MAIKNFKVVVIGAGAVGCYFGGMLARAGETDVVFVARSPQQIEALNQNGLTINSRNFQERIDVNATADMSVVSTADFVLLCVKTTGTETACQSFAPHLSPDALIMSMQNGVDSDERMRSVLSGDIASSVVYIGAEMTAPNTVQHNGRGDLVVGSFQPNAQIAGKLETLAALFERGDVPCVLTDNIKGELWIKLITNCAYNAVSALSRTAYGKMVEENSVRALMEKIVEESLAVARADNVNIDEENLMPRVFKIGEAMPAAFSSTAQDIERGRNTEIDSLNGYIARLGAKLGVSTPINQTLHTLVKQLEQNK